MSEFRKFTCIECGRPYHSKEEWYMCDYCFDYFEELQAEEYEKYYDETLDYPYWW